MVKQNIVRKPDGAKIQSSDITTVIFFHLCVFIFLCMCKYSLRILSDDCMSVCMT